METQTPSKIRLDKYLWAIRMYKTRSLATHAISAGKIKCNGADVKPAKLVQIGEVFDIKREGGVKQTIQCVALLDKRMSFVEASKYYIDITSAEELANQKQKTAFFFNTGGRGNKQGRPTKKNRRDLEGWVD